MDNPNVNAREFGNANFTRSMGQSDHDEGEAPAMVPSDDEPEHGKGSQTITRKYKGREGI